MKKLFVVFVFALALMSPALAAPQANVIHAEAKFARANVDYNGVQYTVWVEDNIMGSGSKPATWSQLIIEEKVWNTVANDWDILWTRTVELTEDQLSWSLNHVMVDTMVDGMQFTAVWTTDGRAIVNHNEWTDGSWNWRLNVPARENVPCTVSFSRWADVPTLYGAVWKHAGGALSKP